MIVFNQKKPEKFNLISEEKRHKGRAVARGIASGKAVCLTGAKPVLNKNILHELEIDSELERFEKALGITYRKIKKLADTSDIFNAHLVILQDDSLIKNIRTRITRNKVNAEWAVKNAFDEYIDRFRRSGEDLLRDKSIDLSDIKDNILLSLDGGYQKSNPTVPPDSIVVVKTLKPSILMELAADQPKAFVTERGGWTSHSFILSRDLRIPAVTGVKNVFDKIKTGDEVITDGYNGLIIVNPEIRTKKDYERAEIRFKEQARESQETFADTIRTLDGRQITIRANLDFRTDTVEYQKAVRRGGRGIGLYRSEYLFNRKNQYPSEEEQLHAYLRIGDMVGKDGVKIRTFDLGDEDFDDLEQEKLSNPALGLRGIRLSLTELKQFQTQIRALLRAAASYQIDIILPMISSTSEVLSAKKIIDTEKKSLRNKNITCGDPQIGAMIEIPAAVLTIEEIIKEVDFVNLGTNDLVQYLLAVDRDDESVADFFKTLHPSVLIAIEKVLRVAEKEGKTAIVCGEMAGSPFYAPVLIGLGATDLSMNINSIGRLRKTIEGIAFEEALELAVQLKKCRTADQIEKKLRSCFQQKWSHLYNPEFLPPVNDLIG